MLLEYWHVYIILYYWIWLKDKSVYIQLWIRNIGDDWLKMKSNWERANESGSCRRWLYSVWFGYNGAKWWDMRPLHCIIGASWVSAFSQLFHIWITYLLGRHYISNNDLINISAMFSYNYSYYRLFDKVSCYN